MVNAVENANDVDNTADEHENTQNAILNNEESNSQAKNNVTTKKQFKSPTLGHVPSRKRSCDDSLVNGALVNEAYEVMTKTLAAIKQRMCLLYLAKKLL